MIDLISVLLIIKWFIYGFFISLILLLINEGDDDDDSGTGIRISPIPVKTLFSRC